MKDILIIMKKELVRFLTDKRMLVTLFMPGVLIYIMYSLMGGFLTDMTSVDEGHKPVILTVNSSDAIAQMLTASEAQLTEVTDVEKAKEDVINENADVLLVFSENFDSEVMQYDPSKGKAPDVEVFYNSASANSSEAYSIVYALLDTYESALANKFDINSNVETEYDLASAENMGAMMYSSLLPMLLLMLLFSGTSAITPESIAGEKERGTMATLLVSPVSRTKIALGKVFALSVIALISGASSAIGTLLALPELFEVSGVDMSSVYTANEYITVFLVILSTVILIVTLMSIMSTYANSIKEAQMMSAPLTIIAIAIGVLSMAGVDGGREVYTYLIPLYNSSMCLGDIFSLAPNSVGLLVTCVSNIVYAALGVLVMTKMFDSEKVMFRL